MTTSNETLQKWVDEVAALTQPDSIHWCTGSEEEYRGLIEKMLASGDLIKLNDSYENCYLHRSDPTDVARVEHLTFICTPAEEDTGPNNHWMAPAEAHAKMNDLFSGCMQGRTMYVIPYCMGPIESPYSRCGVEITDSPYVVANMKLMTRMGSAGFSVSKRNFKKAVQRNLLKRRMREAYRLNKLILTEQADKKQLAVMFIFSGKEIEDFNSIEKGMKKALTKLSRKL